MDKARIAIIGASGYTGAELVRLVATHPGMRIAALAADRNAGRPLAEIYPHLSHLDLPMVTTTQEIDFDQIDLAFCGLPHATAQAAKGPGGQRRPDPRSSEQRPAATSTGSQAASTRPAALQLMRGCIND